MALPIAKNYPFQKPKPAPHPLIPLLLTTLAGICLFVTFLGPATYEIQGFQVGISLKPALEGQTIVELPPLGTLSARTHATPLEITVILKSVNPDIFNHPSTFTVKAFQDIFFPAAREALKRFVLRQLLVATLGAALLTWLILRSSIKRLAFAAAAGLFLMLAVLVLTRYSYSYDAFRQAEFQGAMAAAPQVLDLTGKTLDKLAELRSKTTLVTANLQSLSGRIGRLDLLNAPGTGSTNLLLVADIHNNPLGIDLIQALIKHFNVDAVLDAGDLTDYGSLLETEMVKSLRELDIPYVFAAGNHDSPAVMNFVRQLPRGHVLEGKVITIAGIKILGIPDPWAYRPIPGTGNYFQDQIQQLEEALARNKSKPDILLVHNPQVAEKFAGRVPVLASGHTHRPEIKQIGPSLLVNPGTTGAAGIRGLQASQEVPYSASILYFTPGTPGENPELTAIDMIKYEPLSGRITVERQVTN
ncbi:metallophosphoesterase family protein [Desulfofundulus salinus]|nr:metallophosphoesterase [Desulfofundulus salinum]